MNRYGQMALDHHRRHRASGSSPIPDQESFFAGVGEEIAAQVTRLRDEMLGPRHAGESFELLRLRSYQAWTTAEELTLADHPQFQPVPASEQGAVEDWSDDPDLRSRYQALDEINSTIHIPL